MNLLAKEQERTVQISAFMSGVYLWMSIGLLITGMIAHWFGTTGELSQFAQKNMFLLCIAELGIVFYLCARIERMTALTAQMAFVIYAVLNGITLSTIFMIYTQQSIATTFMICAATFAMCSVYGYTTKKDLTSWGSFLFMGLIGLVIATFVNVLLQSPAIHFATSAIGVIVFVGLTAYDTQKLKAMSGVEGYLVRNKQVSNAAIMGALALYLDFINLFLFFLRFFGVSRD